MTLIEKVKRNGEIAGLKSHIEGLQWEFDRLWEGTVTKDHYSKLGQAITDGESILKSMRDALSALQELDRRNK